jgi:hypothetical protein
MNEPTRSEHTPESPWSLFIRLLWFAAGTGGLTLVLFSKEVPSRDMGEILVLSACLIPDRIDRWLAEPGQSRPPRNLKVLAILPWTLAPALLLAGWLWWPSDSGHLRLLGIAWSILWSMTVMFELLKWRQKRRRQMQVIA